MPSSKKHEKGPFFGTRWHRLVADFAPVPLPPEGGGGDCLALPAPLAIDAAMPTPQMTKARLQLSRPRHGGIRLGWVG